MKTIKDLSPEIIESFRNQLSGELVFPNDANYNETRKVYNGMIDKKTRIICYVRRCCRCYGISQFWKRKQSVNRY